MKVITEFIDAVLKDGLNLTEKEYQLYEEGMKQLTDEQRSRLQRDIHSLKGRQNIYNQLDMMVRNAERSVTIVTTREGLNRKMEALLLSFEKAKKRGVKIRIIAPLNKLSSEDLQTLKEVAEVKQLNGINARFTIIDNKNIIFMLMNDNSIHDNYDVGIWVNTPFFASALENMFNLSWKKA